MSLLSILTKSLLSDVAVSALGKKTGLSAGKLKKLLPLAIPVLLKAMTNNVSSQSGLESLLGALTQHTNKKSLSEQIGEADEKDGGKILGHILGSNSAAAVNSLAQQSGLNDQEVSSALSNITPALLSGLSAATASGASPKFDLSDGLGLDDVMAIFGGGAQQSGGGLLGGLFGGAKPSAGGLLGGLLGQSKEEKDDSLNGTALLSALLSARK